MQHIRFALSYATNPRNDSYSGVALIHTTSIDICFN